MAVGYLVEYRRYGGVTLLLIAKTAAVLFLLGETLTGLAPWAVPAAAAGDGLMALTVVAVVALRRRTARGGSIRDQPPLRRGSSSATEST